MTRVAKLTCILVFMLKYNSRTINCIEIYRDDVTYTLFEIIFITLTAYKKISNNAYVCVIRKHFCELVKLPESVSQNRIWAFTITRERDPVIIFYDILTDRSYFQMVLTPQAICLNFSDTLHKIKQIRTAPSKVPKNIFCISIMITIELNSTNHD